MSNNALVLLKRIKEDLSSYEELHTSQCDDPQLFAANSLRSDMLKKHISVSDRLAADNLAAATFVAVNERVRNFRMADRRVFEWEEELLGTFKNEVYRFFYPRGEPLIATYQQILDRGSLGPGSNIGARGCDFYTKLYSSDLTCSSQSLYYMYKQWISEHPLWESAEQQRLAQGLKVSIVDASKLSFVPKNDTVSRVICSEPTLNMFFQLGIGSILEKRLISAFGIDLGVQPDVNRELARIGSLTERYSTIDLSSASDSFSLDLVQWCIPHDQLSWLTLTRSKRTKLPTSCEGFDNERELEFAMLSTMGNGYTFPLQTALFSCMVSAVYRYLGKTRSDCKRVHDTTSWGSPLRNPDSVNKKRYAGTPNWSVFGDDIIIESGQPTRVMLRLLDLLGFKVNNSKTFVEGPFRESCGHDYFRGKNVRPVYVKSLDTPQARYTVLNRLVEWSAEHGIRLDSSIAFLKAIVKFLPVPKSVGYDAGVHVPSSLIMSLLLDRNTKSPICRYYVARPKVLRIKDACIEVPRGEKTRIYNPDGLFLAMLRGDVRTGMVSIRHDSLLYRMKRSVIPNWDYAPYLPGGSPGWRRWEDAATRYFA